MNIKNFDVIVAKEYESNQGGQKAKRTIWNRVGRAWQSKNSESISFELYLLPNVRYVISLREQNKQPNQLAEASDQLGGENE